jgi:hypothetical protein
LYVRFRLLEDLHFSLNSVTMKKVLHEQVSRFDPLRTDADRPDDSSCPWFEEWKNTFLSNFEMCDHEFIGANFGCIFIITSDELDQHRLCLAELSAKVKAHPTIRWFQPNFFRFYVVLDTQTTAMEADPNVRTQYSELCSLNGQQCCAWLHAQPEVDFCSIEPPPIAIERQVEQLRLVEPEHPLAQSDESQDDSGDFGGDPIDGVDSKPTITILHHDTLLRKLDTLIRDLLTNALLPWSEKQIKLLHEAISLRKGLRRSIFSATKQLLAMSNSVPYRNSGPNSVMYSPEANEMQPRKLADWAMCLRLFELAAQYYNMAKREFQTDSAWFYYAGACEANALASFHLNRLQKQDFESAISCYLDTCKMPALAIRVALLATDVCRKVWPIDAAAMFIRLTDKDHNLKAALFLEQAARCFHTSQPPRKRRAAFHFVLAGNRYSRCGLKRHALACLLRHGHTNWSRCMEHVDHTLSRLHLQLAGSSRIEAQEVQHHRQQALELLRKNAPKEVFFNELIRELTGSDDRSPSDRFEVQILTCRRVHVQPNEGYAVPTSTVASVNSRSARHVCFVGEGQPIALTLNCSFAIDIRSLRLITTNEAVECDAVDVHLDDGIETTVSCTLRATTVEPFEVYAFEFEANGVQFVQRFDERQANERLQFRPIETLPALQLKLRVQDRDVDALELLTGEEIELNVSIRLQSNAGDWRPSRLELVTDADLRPLDTADRLEVLPDTSRTTGFKSESLPSNERRFVLPTLGDHRFRLLSPCLASNHSFFVRLEYADERDQKRRTVTQRLELYLRECTQVEATGAADLYSVRNVQSLNELRVRFANQPEVCLQPGLTAFLRLHDRNVQWIRWACGSRQGQLQLPSASLHV